MELKKVSLTLVLILLTTMAMNSVVLAANDEVVATVNGKAITLAEFYKALEDEAGVYVLSKLIFNELVKQKQEALGVYLDPVAFEQTYNDLVTQISLYSTDGYEGYLAQMGMTDEMFREQLKLELTLSLLAQKEIKVTPEQVIEFFQLNKDYFAQPELVKASHILVKTKEEAQAIIDRLNAGAKFADLAKELSTDEVTKYNGGDLGYFPQGVMVTEFENLAWSLGINEYGMVQTVYGWHVVMVTDKLAAQPADLNAQWDEVEQTLIEYLASDLNSYIIKLEQEADVKILRERYKDAF